MSFERPTLSQIVNTVQQEFVSRLSLSGAVLRRSVVYVLTRVIAGAAHMLHGHLEFLSKQLFPDQSTTTYLERQASVFGMARNEAGYAKATLAATGTNGTDIPEGTIFVRSDGAEYTVDALVTISGGTASPAVTASLAGSDGTLTIGDELNLSSPITGIDSTATVATSDVDGTDEETDAELRVRLLERMRNAPMGGVAADYVAWAKDVSGVTRVWVEPEGLGPGTVLVYFVRDNDVSIIPDAGEIADVQEKLDEEAPAHCTPTAAAPTAVTLDITVSITPDNVNTQAAVEAELADMLFRDAEPGATILFSQIELAVGNATGVEDFTVTVPSGDVTHDEGEIAVLGTVTF